MRRGMSGWGLVAVLALAGCGHDHGDRSHAQEEGPAERPIVSVTRWGEATELFLEYPALVAGSSSRFAVHLTSLADFRPLTEGRAIVRMRPASGPTAEFVVVPSRPGIFGGDVVPPSPGTFEMTLVVDAPPFLDEHALGAVEVLPAGSDVHDPPSDEGDAISFLKEQQWTLDFGTAVVAARPVREVLEVPAEIRARVGLDAVLEAPVAGRIDPKSPARAPGSRVRAGDVVAMIVAAPAGDEDGASLRRALSEAEQDLGIAERDHARAVRLVEAGAAPERRGTDAAAALERAKARLEEARALVDRHEAYRGAPPGEGRFLVRSPFAGVVAEARVVPGATVAAGAPLARIVDPDSLEAVGAVPETQLQALVRASGAEIVLHGGSVVPGGAPVAGRVVDPASRTVAVRSPIEGGAARLAIGQSARLRLFLDTPREVPCVPASAIVDDAGRPVVFEQAAGESFRRRPVTLGVTNAGFVEIVDGVRKGDRIVTRGAHLIRLASMSSQVPAHGHVH